jgi:hypothetical protein
MPLAAKVTETKNPPKMTQEDWIGLGYGTKRLFFRGRFSLCPDLFHLCTEFRFGRGTHRSSFAPPPVNFDICNPATALVSTVAAHIGNDFVYDL